MKSQPLPKVLLIIAFFAASPVQAGFFDWLGCESRLTSLTTLERQLRSEIGRSDQVSARLRAELKRDQGIQMDDLEDFYLVFGQTATDLERLARDLEGSDRGKKLYGDLCFEFKKVLLSPHDFELALTQSLYTDSPLRMSRMTENYRLALDQISRAEKFELSPFLLKESYHVDFRRFSAEDRDLKALRGGQAAKATEVLRVERLIRGLSWSRISRNERSNADFERDQKRMLDQVVGIVLDASEKHYTAALRAYSLELAEAHVMERSHVFPGDWNAPMMVEAIITLLEHPITARLSARERQEAAGVLAELVKYVNLELVPIRDWRSHYRPKIEAAIRFLTL
ncbi:MAG: hypothetical protein H7222_15940 [Methylotenera sp.]|nr:hypothetical protein [Oligoflexia bacterium]